MKKNTLILLLFFYCLTSVSCKKFLDEQSQTDIIPRTVESLNELLLGSGYQRSDKQVGSKPYFMDDDIDNTEIVTGSQKSSYYVYTWQPDQSVKVGSNLSYDPWTQYYALIQICNVVLDYSTKVTGEQADKDDVNGQAYLLRAFYYFKLVNLFGKPYTDKLSAPDQDLGVPLILKSGVSLEGKPRNTVKEVYLQILDDLDKGISLMEKNKRNNGIYRINYTAGYLLSSRVHLSLGNWAKAAEAATTALNYKAALADLNTWGTPNQNTKPIISGTNPETIWAFGDPYDAVFGDPDLAKYSLSPSLLSMYEPGDLRRSIYISGSKSIKRPLSTYYMLNVGQAFRVPEALLNRAEAYAQLNKLGMGANAQLALNDLNTLRKKRFDPAFYADLTGISSDDLLQKCKDEKRREFFDEEEHRWFDLRRHGMPSFDHYYYESATQKFKYTLLDHDPAYIMQMNSGVLTLNPQLIDNPKPPVRVGQ